MTPGMGRTPRPGIGPGMTPGMMMAGRTPMHGVSAHSDPVPAICLCHPSMLGCTFQS